MISVVLPFHQNSRTLQQAIESILNQTYKNLEFILVENKADTESISIVKSFVTKDKRVKLFHQPTLGVAHAFNLGIEKARYDFIARMDADDIAFSNKLEIQLQFLKANTDIAAVGTQTEYKGVSQGFQEYVTWQNKLITWQEHALHRFIESPVANPTLLFRKSLISRYGNISTENIPEDYEILLRWMAEGEKIAKIPQKLLIWNDTPSRLTRNHPYYTKEAFRKIKYRYLADFLTTLDLSHREIIICGASAKSRKKAQYLETLNVKVAGYTDVKTYDFEGFNALSYLMQKPKNYFFISVIEKRGVGTQIHDFLQSHGLKKGLDFIIAG